MPSHMRDHDRATTAPTGHGLSRTLLLMGVTAVASVVITLMVLTPRHAAMPAQLGRLHVPVKLPSTPQPQAANAANASVDGPELEGRSSCECGGQARVEAVGTVPVHSDADATASASASAAEGAAPWGEHDAWRHYDGVPNDAYPLVAGMKTSKSRREPW